MNNKKRNQLIGFITLILIVLLIAPYVITDKPNKRESMIMLLPQEVRGDDNTPPQADEFPIIDVPSSNETNEQLDTAKESNPENQLPSDTSVNNSNQPVKEGYVIQLVALKNSQKIEELVALLRLNNYDAYTVPKIPKDGQTTRLFVGYYLTKEQANVAIIDLEKLTKLHDFIIIK